MKKILTFVVIGILIGAATFCCCTAGLAFPTQEHSCCAKNSADHSHEQCSLQNNQPLQHHSCECQKISSVLPSVDFKITNSLAWTQLFVNPWTCVTLVKIFVHHPQQHLTVFGSPPDLFASLIPFSKNPVLRL